MNNYKEKYIDILNYEYKGPKNHKRMSIEARTSQFAAFQALTGYEDKINEEIRITEKEIILDDTEKEIINNKLLYIESNLEKNIIVTLTYFIKDIKKEGGKYIKENIIIKRIDKINGNIISKDNKIINLNNIIDIYYDNEKY